jgi:putative flippase GtrA
MIGRALACSAVSGETYASLPLHRRIKVASRILANWLQFGRYAIVGVLGWGISIATFAFLYHVVGVGSTVAATGAFCLALTNNFLWNRHWTFKAGDGHVGFQASRFVFINICAFLWSLVVLRVMIDVVGVPPVVAQTIAVLSAAPPNFIAHRIWSFRI